MTDAWGQVYVRAIEACDGDLRAVAVYAVLATWRNANTDACWPKRAQIAARLRVSEDTVWRGLRTLERLGLIERESVVEGGKRVGTGTRIRDVPRRESAAASRAREPLPKRREEQTMNTNKEQKSIASVTAIDGRLIDVASIPERLVTAWAELTRRTGRHRVTPKRERMVRARLENYDEEELLDALRGLAASEWHVARGFTEFERALGTDEALEHWRDAWRDDPRQRTIARLAEDPSVAMIRSVREMEGR